MKEINKMRKESIGNEGSINSMINVSTLFGNNFMNIFSKF